MLGLKTYFKVILVLAITAQCLCLESNKSKANIDENPDYHEPPVNEDEHKDNRQVVEKNATNVATPKIEDPKVIEGHKDKKDVEITTKLTTLKTEEPKDVMVDNKDSHKNDATNNTNVKRDDSSNGSEIDTVGSAVTSSTANLTSVQSKEITTTTIAPTTKNSTHTESHPNNDHTISSSTSSTQGGKGDSNPKGGKGGSNAKGGKGPNDQVNSAAQVKLNGFFVFIFATVAAYML